MSGLFFGYTSLESIHLDNYELNPSSMADFFNKCSSLKNVSLKVNSVLTVERFFKGCNSLEYVDLSKFNGSSVKFYQEFFPENAKNTTILYNSTNIGYLLRNIPEGWIPIDINNIM